MNITWKHVHIVLSNLLINYKSTWTQNQSNNKFLPSKADWALKPIIHLLLTYAFQASLSSLLSSNCTVTDYTTESTLLISTQNLRNEYWY